MPSLLELNRALLMAINSLTLADPCACGKDPDGEVVISDFEPYQGDPEYGGMPLDTWDDYDDALCGAAHWYVDNLTNNASNMQHLLSVGAVTVTYIAAALAVLSGAGLLIAVSWAAAASATAAMASAVGTGIFEQASIDIEAARDDIICAIIDGFGLSSAIAAAVSPEAWTIYYRWVNWANAQATLTQGYNQAGVVPVKEGAICVPCTPAAQDFYLEIRIGTALPGGYYESARQSAGDSASYISIAAYEDADFQTPVEIYWEYSDDSANGTRIPVEKVYRALNINNQIIYQANEYFAGVAWRVVMKHTGSTPFTVHVLTEPTTD
jgi:hypothetical protein